MKNILILPAEVNCGTTVIEAQQSNNNALMIRSDIMLLRVNKIEDDVMSMNYKFSKEGG